jgi:hypothetical protein
MLTGSSKCIIFFSSLLRRNKKHEHGIQIVGCRGYTHSFYRLPDVQDLPFMHVPSFPFVRRSSMQSTNLATYTALDQMIYR